MKNIFIYLITLAIVLNSVAQTPQTDWEKMELKGKVASLKEYNFSLPSPVSSFVAPKLNTVTEYSFNENGYLVSEIARGKDSLTQLYKILYTYDKNGFLIGKDIFYKPGPSTVQKRFTYYPDGKLMDEEQWLIQDLQNKSHYTYNKKNQLVEKSTLYPYEPDQSFKVTYKYNENGNLVEKNTDQVGIVYPRELYGYDEHGNLAEISYAKKKGDKVVTIRLNYELDEKGNWTRLSELPDKEDWPDRYLRERQLIYF